MGNGFKWEFLDHLLMVLRPRNAGRSSWYMWYFVMDLNLLMRYGIDKAHQENLRIRSTTDIHIANSANEDNKKREWVPRCPWYSQRFRLPFNSGCSISRDIHSKRMLPFQALISTCRIHMSLQRQAQCLFPNLQFLRSDHQVLHFSPLHPDGFDRKTFGVVMGPAHEKDIYPDLILKVDE